MATRAKTLTPAIHRESGAGDALIYWWHVPCLRTAEQTVVGYYALAVGSVSRRDATGRVRRNMPDPVPVIILARLAVDSHWHGQGLGAALLRDAALRTRQAADLAGIRAMLVHAISPEAARFHRYFGFQQSPGNETTLMITLGVLEQALRWTRS